MTSTHKEIATQLIAKLSAADLDGALALLTDDATWTIIGKPELTPSAGVYDKRKLKKLFQLMQSQLTHWLQLRVLDVIGEGDKVSLEAESSGDLKNGRKYRQTYHFKLEFRDGKIVAVREYLDTHHAWDVWMRP